MRSGVAAAVLAVVLAGCSDGASTLGTSSSSPSTPGQPGPSATHPTGSPSPPATGSPSASASASEVTTPGPTRFTTSPSGTVRLDDGDDGRTVTVPVGTRITVVLQSTYWSFGGGSTSVVREDEKHAPSGSCPPGVGCGTVTGTYRAVAAGSGDITASRTVCGEAVACRPDQRSYVVHVRVG